MLVWLEPEVLDLTADLVVVVVVLLCVAWLVADGVVAVVVFVVADGVEAACDVEASVVAEGVVVVAEGVVVVADEDDELDDEVAVVVLESEPDTAAVSL